MSGAKNSLVSKARLGSHLMEFIVQSESTVRHLSTRIYHSKVRQFLWRKETQFWINIKQRNPRSCGGKGTFLPYWWGCKVVQPLWKTVWKFLKKVKTELPYDPAVLLLDMYLMQTIIWKDTCTPVFTAALFGIMKTWKQPKCPSRD